MYRFWSSVGVLVASAALLASCTGGGTPSQQGLVPSARTLIGNAHYDRGTRGFFLRQKSQIYSTSPT